MDPLQADFCVIGAGYAGLAAAYKLQKAGKTVVVLEARDRIGGKVFTQTLPDGTAINMGGTWIGAGHTRLYELAKEFGASDTQGALVGDVMKDSPAEKAKLERGDIITSYNRTPIKDPAHLRSLVAETAPGTTVTLSILREKKREDVALTIGELPKDVPEAAGRSGEGVRGEHALAGVTVEDLSESRSGQSRHRSGVVVTNIEANSPAEQAGLRVSDVIIEINRKPIRNVRDFEQVTSRLGARSSVLVLLGRGNATIYLSINPGR